MTSKPSSRSRSTVTPAAKGKSASKAKSTGNSIKSTKAKTSSQATTAKAIQTSSANEPQAEGGLKQRFAALASATGKISGLKNALSKNFFDVGIILNQIRDQRLYEVKGYGSFEAFVEREIAINKKTCLRSARIAEAMQREVALQAGLDRASAAVAVLDGESLADHVSVRDTTGHALPIVPLHKQ